MNLRTVTVGDIDLAIAEAGKGGTPLLLVHGFTGAKEDFGDFLDAFANEGWHVVAPDLRGHGGSSQPADEAAYSLELMAGDVLGLADALGWERFALLGHSMGGMVVQHVAMQAPQRLRALILMDTGHAPVDIAEDLVEAGVSIARTDGMAVLLAVQNDLEGPLATAADARVRAERPGYIEFGEAKLLTSSPAMYAAMAVVLTSPPDRLDGLRAVDVPTLVLVGDQDEPFIPDSERMAAAMPDARLVVIPDAGHSPQFEAPEAWWAAVTGVLSEYAPPADRPASAVPAAG